MPILQEVAAAMGKHTLTSKCQWSAPYFENGHVVIPALDKLLGWWQDGKFVTQYDGVPKKKPLPEIERYFRAGGTTRPQVQAEPMYAMPAGGGGDYRGIIDQMRVQGAAIRLDNLAEMPRTVRFDAGDFAFDWDAQTVPLPDE